METTVLKCPSCNSSLPYDAEKRLWKCTYCGSEFTREQILELTAQKSDADIDIKKPEYKEDTEIPEDQPELNLYRMLMFLYVS